MYYGVATPPSDIEGWLSDEQGRYLCAAAAATRGAGAIVEIGSWKGRSTSWLALGASRAGRRVHAIDPHEGSREDPSAHTLDAFLENLRRAGVSDTVEPLVMTSTRAAGVLTGPVELLFIDGDHSPAAVARDAEAERIIVGLPLNMDGTEGPRARAARDFGEALRQATDLPVEFWDERLSTAEGEARLRGAGLDRRELSKRSDAAAAIVILETYLEKHS